MNIKIVRLNNKSRKGLYLYLKEKGSRGMYYKFKGDEYIDAYKKYYEDKYVNKRKIKSRLVDYVKIFSGKKLNKGVKGKRRITKEADEYVKRVKGKSINNTFKRGVSAVIIPDARVANQKDMNEANRKLFDRVVLDKQILDILITDENLKKLANRMEFRLSFINEKGKEIASANKFGVTLREVVSDVKSMIRNNEEISDANKTYENKFIRKVREVYNYKNVNIKGNGKIRKTKLTMIFRKG